MFAALTLGIFDAVEHRPATAVELADELHLSAEPLGRLLDTCVALGLLQKTGQAFLNQPVASTYLCRKSHHSLTGYIVYSDRILYRLWGHLDDAVREGGARWKQEFGSDGGIFDHFFRTPEAKQEFLKGMHGLGLLSSAKLVSAFDMSRFRRFVDLGGATGHLALAACERYPQLHAVVFDLAEVIDTARQYCSASNLMSGRIDLIAGDFFQDELPEADIFALGRILHDWPEEKIRPLLLKIYQRLPARGAILIAEKILDEDKTGPAAAVLQSLNMLLCTEGKERTLSEYRALLEGAGFDDIQAVRTGAYLDAIMATKAPQPWSAK